MKTLQKLACEQKGRFYSLYSLSIAFGIIVVAQAFFIVSIVDDLFLGEKSFQQVIPFFIGLAVVLFIRALLSYSSGQIGVKMASVVKSDFRKKLLQAYSGQSLLTSYKGQSGKKVSVMLDTVDEIDSFYSSYVPQRILSTVASVIILIAVFSQHFYSGLIIIITAPFIPLFMAIIGMQTQKKSEEKLDSLNTFSGRFLETLQGLTSLKVFGRSHHYKEVIRSSSLHFRDSTMDILKVAFMSSLMLEFISMLSIGLVALELGLRLVVFQQISFFTAFFILLLVPEFFHLLKELGSAFHAGRSSSGAATKIEEALIEQGKKVQWGQEKLPNNRMEVKLQNVGFSYGEGFALQKVDYTFPATGQIAIVGRSGAGKTTLLHVVAGLLQPTEGTVIINGKNRNDYEEKEWFQRVSYITQHPYLFSGSIAENIALGLKVNDSDMEEAIKKANITELVESLPDGVNTVIGEGGRGLSGGEKQRIALARAFLKKPSIILFDEPTSGLDLMTEKLLQQSIREMAKHALVITVAHRLQTIKSADQILFVQNGEIAAIGTDEQLRTSVIGYEQLFKKGGEVQ
ncbi:thiol reductant ABC exporter subunit CydD [Sutcliffiella sp. NC1]|uniref:thiol reductant ABC exporter subunit CydD n=1 Tax=Sutcliffiella sp. NC1 TaxID=3004096 RepID=UPI0022DDA091|nr:thiol reductant ABC exporter subunit CydD [Sutcliffiella sp. NC1]WBL17202.1 thiol reductant ABC exporter subunit CydD [Sutcliffiella sp. NC1]